MRNPEKPDPTDNPNYFDRLDWSIKGRAQTQITTARLFKILKDNPTGEKKFQHQALLLTDVSFSLWRAVFLYDRTGKLENKQLHAKSFLQAMLEDNSITYTRDKLSSEWTFNYYINSALYRLTDLSDLWEDGKSPPLKPLKRTSRNRWDCLQKAFELAVERLALKVENT